MHRKRAAHRIALAILVAGLLGVALPTGSPAQSSLSTGVISGVKVTGNSLSATIGFASGVAVDLELRFENVIGLGLSNIGLSAALVDPLDPSLLNRLPSGQPISIPGQFPVLLSIEPPASGPLSFTGVYTLELHTHNLTYQGSSPLRLFRSHQGGDFEEITSLIAPGSYRARGTDGGFSQFLIGSDLRPVDLVIDRKFVRLRWLLDSHADLLSTELGDDLRALLDDAESRWSNGQLVASITALDAFAGLVVEHSGGAIPNVWRSTRDLTNLGGNLRGAASTVQFSLNQKANGAP